MYLSAEAAQRHRNRAIDAMAVGDLLIAPASCLTVRNSDVPVSYTHLTLPTIFLV